MKKSKIIIFSLLFLAFIYVVFPYFIKVEIKKIQVSTLFYDKNNYEIGEIINDGKYNNYNYNYKRC